MESRLTEHGQEHDGLETLDKLCDVTVCQSGGLLHIREPSLLVSFSGGQNTSQCDTVVRLYL